MVTWGGKIDQLLTDGGRLEKNGQNGSRSVKGNEGEIMERDILNKEIFEGLCENLLLQKFPKAYAYMKII